VNAEDSIATGLHAVARALRDLGNGNACTPMGAIEAYSVVVKEGAEAIASAIRELAEAVRDSAS
jgi:hypothetical protein